VRGAGRNAGPDRDRRQEKAEGEQLSSEDVGGWRIFSFITNAVDEHRRAVDLDLHHRRRGGASEEAIRQLKEDFGMNHAPVQNFFGNWLCWLAAALPTTSDGGSASVNAG
jgi:hypothetical protein